MSAEFRHIFFNNGELVRILAMHAKRQAAKLPSGAVLGLKIASDPEPMVCGKIAPDGGGTPISIELGGKELRSAVIAYCIAQRIPLPAKGIKRLDVFNKRLALVISMNVKGERLGKV